MTCTLSKDSTTNSKSLLQSSNKSRAISYSCISTLQNSPFEFISQFVWITLYFTVCSNNMISTEKRKIFSEPENGKTNKSALKLLYCRHHCRKFSPSQTSDTPRMKWCNNYNHHTRATQIISLGIFIGTVFLFNFDKGGRNRIWKVRNITNDEKKKEKKTKVIETVKQKSLTREVYKGKPYGSSCPRFL